jgi:dihydrofolate reductase
MVSSRGPALSRSEPMARAMTKRLRYQVATSLDGFIATPNGGYDWLVMDPAIDFKALYNEFDTAVMGRKTYDLAKEQANHGAMPGIEVIAFSRTLEPVEYPGVRIVNDDPTAVVRGLKTKPGKDIWLFGGGELFRVLLDAGLVDTVELAVMPILLGDGIPVLPPGAAAALVLSDVKRLAASGIVVLAYSVAGSTGRAPRIRYVKARRKKKQTTPNGKGKRRGKSRKR